MRGRGGGVGAGEGDGEGGGGGGGGGGGVQEEMTEQDVELDRWSVGLLGVTLLSASPDAVYRVCEDVVHTFIQHTALYCNTLQRTDC